MGSEPDVIPKHWVCIYPAYINSRKTLEEGRRVGKEKGVDNPTTQEIFDVLKASGLTVRAERKMYSREGTRDWTFNGRIRVELKKEDGSLADPAFPSRKSLLLHAAQMIPKLKSRLQKSAAADNQKPQASSKPPKKGKKNR